MAESIKIKDNSLGWKELGDAIDEYYIHFLNSTPYFVVFISTILISGILPAINEYLLFYLIVHSLTYWFFFSSRKERSSNPQMGAISDAREELERAEKAGEVPKDVYYFSHYSTVVKDFKGETPEQARRMNLHPNNTLYEYLVPKKLYMTHTLLSGATGAGKTVAITSAYIEPIVASGGGFIMAECKGDMPITKGCLSLIAEYGREDDAFVLDFAGGSKAFTHSIAPLLVGDAVTLHEALSNMVKIMDGDNAWVSTMGLKFMGALMFIFVIMRDLNIFIDAKNIKDIKAETWETDFNKYDKKNFSFEQLRGYVNYQIAIDLLYLFREMASEESFRKALRNHPNYKEVKTKDRILSSFISPLENFLRERSVNIDNPMEKPDYMNDTPADNFKNNNLAIDMWTEAFELFGNHEIFGAVVNAAFPDINFYDAIKNGKIIIITLPSLKNSRDKNEKIGKFITSLIKGAIAEMMTKVSIEGTKKEEDKQLRFRPYKLPYMLLFDEIGNIGNEMFGALASMIRSIGVEGGGMGMLFSGQSKTDFDRMGQSGMDGKQTLDNLGLKYFLNSAGEWAEYASKEAGEKYNYEFDENLIIKSDKNENSPINVSFKKEKQKRFEDDFFIKGLKKETGEGVIIQNGFIEPQKVVCRYVEAKESTEIQLIRSIPHTELMKEFTEEYIAA